MLKQAQWQRPSGKLWLNYWVTHVTVKNYWNKKWRCHEKWTTPDLPQSQWSPFSNVIDGYGRRSSEMVFTFYHIMTCLHTKIQINKLALPAPFCPHSYPQFQMSNCHLFTYILSTCLLALRNISILIHNTRTPGFTVSTIRIITKDHLAA